MEQDDWNYSLYYGMADGIPKPEGVETVGNEKGFEKIEKASGPALEREIMEKARNRGISDFAMVVRFLLYADKDAEAAELAGHPERLGEVAKEYGIDIWKQDESYKRL